MALRHSNEYPSHNFSAFLDLEICEVPEPWPAWVIALVQKIIRAFCDALDRARRFGRHEGGSMAIFAALTDIPQVFSVGAGRRLQCVKYGEG
jgi:hypothetical protein